MKKNINKQLFQKTLYFISVITLAVTALPTLNASAQTAVDICANEQLYEQYKDFAAKNDNMYYNPCGGLASSACSTGTGDLSGPAPTSLSGETNAEKVWNYMTGRGLSPVATAGAMGNIERESGFSASIEEASGGGGLGLIQWTGPRRTGLENAAAAAGVSLRDNDTALLFQLNYLWEGEYPDRGLYWQEPMNNETSVEGDPYIASYNSRFASQRAATQEGNGTTMMFHALIERSNDVPTEAERQSGAGVLSHRIDSANAFLEQYANAGGTGGGCTIAEGGLTEEQAKILMMNYGENRDNDSVTAMNSGSGRPGTGCAGGALSNCVSFSAFFANKFTNLRYMGGNGNDVVSNMAAAGYQTGSEPRPFAVFSNGFGTDAGHTGIVLGIDGDTLIVGHASCSHSGTGRGDGTREGMGAGYVITGIESVALTYTDQAQYAYPDEVDMQAIQDYINR